MPKKPKNATDGVSQADAKYPALEAATGIKKRSDKGMDAPEESFETRGGNKDKGG